MQVCYQGGDKMSGLTDRVLSFWEKKLEKLFFIFPKVLAGLTQYHMEPCSDTDCFSLEALPENQGSSIILASHLPEIIIG